MQRNATPSATQGNAMQRNVTFAVPVAICAQALKQPERGLIMPIVRYLSFCPDPTLSDELLELVSDFDLVRNQVLTLIEYLDEIGLSALDRAIDKGGMDHELDVLLETREWLTHCVERKSA